MNTEFERRQGSAPAERVAVPLFLGVLLLLSCRSLAADEDRDAIVAAMAAADVPGVAVAVVHGREIDVAAYGSAAPDANVPVTDATVFEAASLSKTVFAAMVIEAAADGALSLDEPLAATAAAARVTDRALYRRLTPRLLLSHQSGLPNWAGDATDHDRTDPLEFNEPPGTGYGYSGEGYELLRAHVGETLGRPLEDWFAAHRDSYGMRHSRYAYATVPASAATARGVSSETNRGMRPSVHPLAAASLITTAPDYGRFIRYLLANDDLMDRLFAPQVTVEESARGAIRWALGWGIVERPDGSRVAFHWGDNWQFKAFVAIDRANAAGIVYFANGVNGLRLIPEIAEPVVGDLQMVRDWLGYERE